MQADRREHSLKEARSWALSLFVLALAGCGARHLGPSSHDVVAAPTRAGSFDAGDARQAEGGMAPVTLQPVEASVLDAGMPDDAAAPDASAGWGQADTCGRVSKGIARCCQPSAELSLCVEDESPHHVVGAFDSKFLVVREVASRRKLATFALERRSYFSMARQAPLVARLDFEVTARGLLLIARSGCNDPRDPAIEKICAQAREHVWRDGGFASER